MARSPSPPQLSASNRYNTAYQLPNHHGPRRKLPSLPPSRQCSSTLLLNTVLLPETEEEEELDPAWCDLFDRTLMRDIEVEEANKPTRESLMALYYGYLNNTYRSSYEFQPFVPRSSSSRRPSSMLEGETTRSGDGGSSTSSTRDIGSDCDDDNIFTRVRCPHQPRLSIPSKIQQALERMGLQRRLTGQTSFLRDAVDAATEDECIALTTHPTATATAPDPILTVEPPAPRSPSHNSKALVEQDSTVHDGSPPASPHPYVGEEQTASPGVCIALGTQEELIARKDGSNEQEEEEEEAYSEDEYEDDEDFEEEAS